LWVLIFSVLAAGVWLRWPAPGFTPLTGSASSSDNPPATSGLWGFFVADAAAVEPSLLPRLERGSWAQHEGANDAPARPPVAAGAYMPDLDPDADGCVAPL